MPKGRPEDYLPSVKAAKKGGKKPPKKGGKNPMAGAVPKKK